MKRKSITQHPEQNVPSFGTEAARVAVSSALLCLTALPLFSQSAVADAGTLAAKKPGAVRIAIAMPKTQMGQAANGANEALRNLEMQYLRGPGIEPVVLDAMLPMQMAAEAKAKECDYILYSTLSEKVNNNSSLFKKALPMVSMIPMAGALGGVAGSVAGAVAIAAASGAAGLTGDVKAKSEVTYDYKLTAASESGGTAKLGETLKAKAKQDGEDIISPLIEQAATNIVTHVKH